MKIVKNREPPSYGYGILWFAIILAIIGIFITLVILSSVQDNTTGNKQLGVLNDVKRFVRENDPITSSSFKVTNKEITKSRSFSNSLSNININNFKKYNKALTKISKAKISEHKFNKENDKLLLLLKGGGETKENYYLNISNFWLNPESKFDTLTIFISSEDNNGNISSDLNESITLNCQEKCLIDVEPKILKTSNDSSKKYLSFIYQPVGGKEMKISDLEIEFYKQI
jgi:hypothetical protein